MFSLIPVFFACGSFKWGEIIFIFKKQEADRYISLLELIHQWPEWKDRVYPQQVSWCYKTGRRGWYTWKLCWPDLGSLENCGDRNLMKFKQANARSCIKGGINPGTSTGWGWLVESSSVEMDLGVLLDSKLPMSWHCVLVARKHRGILGSIRKSIASR